MTKRRFVRGVSMALALLAAAPVHAATSVLPMNLDQLSQRAGKIFRGRVIDIRAGSVDAGGGTLPTTIYRIQVDEALKGSYARDRKGAAFAEIQMVGSLRPAAAPGRTRVLPLLPDVPQLQVGQEYLLFATTPSRIGLSTTVGLGQGCFKVYRPRGRDRVAVNAVDNRDLFRGMEAARAESRGPASYDELVRHVRAALGPGARTR
jgi:hypothetical protein